MVFDPKVTMLAVGLGYLSVRMIVHKCLVAPIKVAWMVVHISQIFSVPQVIA